MAAWTLLLFGRSGSYKTSELRHIARRVYAKHGKITRLVSSDGGGWTPLQPEIDVGIIEPWRVSLAEQPLSVYRKLSKGYWPHVVSQNGARRIALVEPSSKTWEHVGAYLVEGLSSISAVLMRDHLAKQRKISGEDFVATFSEQVLTELADGRMVEDVEKYTFPGRGHYNSVQQSVYEIVIGFSALPVHHVGFTALETAGEEKLTRKTHIGPLVIGQATTTVAPSWVGDCIHMDTFNSDVMAQVKGQDGKPVEAKVGMQTNVRAYFTPHPDLETGITVTAKPRVPPERWPALKEQFKGGFYVPTPEHGLDTYLDAEEKLIGTSADALRTWKAEVDAQRVEAQAKAKEVSK